MHAALVGRPGTCIRRLGRGRAGEMQFRRLLHNRSVTDQEMSLYAGGLTGQRASGRHIVVAQDTSEVVLGSRQARPRFGPVGKGNAAGVLLHAALAVEAGSNAVLGLVSMQVWNRGREALEPRRKRATSGKESKRWIESTRRAGEVLAKAASVTMVSDRESDFYELLVQRPDNVDLVIRACQNRRIEAVEEAPDLLFDFIDAGGEQGRFVTTIPAAPGRRARNAELVVRFAPVIIRRPLHGADKTLPETVKVTLVDVREVSAPEDGSAAVHWRLLTTHQVASLQDARRVIGFYRTRWMIEEFFRTLKTAGFDIESAEIGDPHAMVNFVAAAAVAAVTIKQLVQARDGDTDQRLSDAFDPADQPLLAAVSASLEGKTARQRNPHPRGSLAFAAWVIARLGGWTGYYGKPGPKVMRIGLTEFRAIKYGANLVLQDV